MDKSRIWVLGALDPEMVLIDRVLREYGETVVYAANRVGERVTPATAYRGESLVTDYGYHPCTHGVTTVYLVECDLVEHEVLPLDFDFEESCHPELAGRTVRRIDHHRPGDPGYGRPPEEFFEASSIGQVVLELTRLRGRDIALYMPQDLVLAAAADHCLAAAYRGECPGVDPDELMRWRVETRAAFQGRQVEELLADVEEAIEEIRYAPTLRDVRTIEHRRVVEAWEYDRVCNGQRPDPDTWYRRRSEALDAVYVPPRELEDVLDLRGYEVPELPEAAAREGVAYLATVAERDGRTKVVLGGHTTPEMVMEFMEHWAPAHGLVGIYGDPARGFAGAYMPEEE